jgi:hypothetical protein
VGVIRVPWALLCVIVDKVADVGASYWDDVQIECSGVWICEELFSGG